MADGYGMNVFRSAQHPGWPAHLGPVRVGAGVVSLRPIRLRDASAWSRIRIRDKDYLEKWEPTGRGPWEARNHSSNWPALWSSLKAEARRGGMIPFVIEVDGQFGGQLTVGNIVRGALRSAWIGYWVSSELAGQGVATAALALGLDHCFTEVGLHRVEATVRPENLASQAVLRNVGFREEGLLQRYLDVDGAWRDHLLVGMTVEEVSGTVVDRLIRAGRAARV
ncbi:Ribosomal-protein-alanine N-acetyltransferase [Nocardia seriolae]|uniref:Ribosomal-protein-alanine N-acetyltransferase n=2 Tax=Nocardia seriolae TaxID=37332 RepID=A0ABC8ANE4_9NOCA|nr:Ribosomal-protein-alanine N-acetyltransferase [Nocardia seriolae]BEK85080.1 GNAT family protein [Nocardia seriolae]BEK99078.1 GNAT family protein [Nocardia seriolae]GEM28584.1 putative ribosomal-protein-alanine acetyltransferase RimJ [Nocardia seriolae NBRC 15557]